jgi:hypothetical protein
MELNQTQWESPRVWDRDIPARRMRSYSAGLSHRRDCLLGEEQPSCCHFVKLFVRLVANRDRQIASPVRSRASAFFNVDQTYLFQCLSLGLFLLRSLYLRNNRDKSYIPVQNGIFRQMDILIKEEASFS